MTKIRLDEVQEMKLCKSFAYPWITGPGLASIEVSDPVKARELAALLCQAASLVEGDSPKPKDGDRFIVIPDFDKDGERCGSAVVDAAPPEYVGVVCECKDTKDAERIASALSKVGEINEN